MLVFDASGSMSGDEPLSGGGFVTRLERVRDALHQVLPTVAQLRRVGLITYGPGPYNRCDNIELNLKPTENAAGVILDAIDALIPAGRTPLTAAVEQAAEVLQYRERPGVVVLLTDGEETCGGKPCEMAKRLKAQAKQLTVHVIGYRLKNFSWTGAGSFEMRCLPEENNGLYISVETTDELIAALNKTLGCPIVTQAMPSAMIRNLR